MKEYIFIIHTHIMSINPQFSTDIKMKTNDVLFGCLILIFSWQVQTFKCYVDYSEYGTSLEYSPILFMCPFYQEM